MSWENWGDGRVGLREPRKGRTKKGRKKFAAKWREPRLFIIDAVDEQGLMADDFAQIIDGTLASCDRLCEMLQAYLARLNPKDLIIKKSPSSQSADWPGSASILEDFVMSSRPKQVNGGIKTGSLA